MSYEAASSAIQGLQDASTSFDYEKASRYLTFVKEFLRRAQKYCETTGIPLVSPFIETTPNCNLPPELSDKVLLIAHERQWSRTCIFACQMHIRFLLNREQIPESEQNNVDVYEPLFELLLEGGDFYEHHRDICIRDAATVIVKR
jgi:hypothetical protein